MSVKRGIGKFLATLIGIPVAVVVVVFVITNRQPVRVDFWPLSILVDVPLSLVLLTAAVGGFLMGALVHWLIAAQLRWRAHQAIRRAEDAERELAILRAQRQPPPMAATQRALPQLTDAA